MLASAPSAGPPIGTRTKPAGADAASCTINHDHDVPEMSAMSADGRTFYYDRNLPEHIELKGKTIQVALPLYEHETNEWRRMKELHAEFEAKHGRKPKEAERIKIYDRAHDEAGTPAEREWIKSHDYDWGAWSAWTSGKLAGLEHMKHPVERPVEDADVRPVPHHHALFSVLDDGEQQAQDALAVPAVQMSVTRGTFVISA